MHKNTRQLTKQEKTVIKISDVFFALGVGSGGLLVYYRAYQYLTTGTYGSLVLPVVLLTMGGIMLFPRLYSVILKKGSD